MTTPIRPPLTFSQLVSQWQERSESPDVPGLSASEQLGEALGIPMLRNLSGYTPHSEFVRGIPIAFARVHGVIGLVDPAAGSMLVIADLNGLPACDTVIRILRTSFKIAFAETDAIREALNAAYEQLGGQTSQTLASIDGQRLKSDGASSVIREDLLDSGEREPVVKLVNSLLFEAVTTQASDVHIQPDEQHVLVRYRIDGILHDVHSIPKSLQNEVLSRIKVIGQMNIAEKRLSQDGRATVEVGNRSIDLRLASMPTNHGERIVIRLLEKDSRIETLSQLGMSDDHVTRLRQLIQYEHGMILVTGPKQRPLVANRQSSDNHIWEKAIEVTHQHAGAEQHDESGWISSDFLHPNPGRGHQRKVRFEILFPVAFLKELGEENSDLF